MKANIEQKGGRKQSFGDKQARLAKVERVSLIGDFEQRRSGLIASGNKAASFECGNTDRFKAQCPIWIKRRRNGQAKDRHPMQRGDQKVRKEKEKENRFIVLVWKTKNWAQKMQKYRRTK